MAPINEPLNTQAVDNSSSDDLSVREEVLKQAEQKLDNLVGLTAIKQRCKALIKGLKTQNARRDAGLRVRDLPMHTALVGPPGTAKTTFARILGEIYYGCGSTRKSTFIEVGREDLVTRYIGSSDADTKEVLEAITGGTLF